MRSNPRLGLAAIAVLASLTALVPNVPTSGAQAPSGSDWSARATALRGRNGERFVFECPPWGTVGSVWGTDIYTDDSSVCTAAVHAGRITLAGGGRVVIEILPGQQAYTGSNRNRVASSGYGAWSGSFSIISAESRYPPERSGGDTWGATASQFASWVGARITFRCPSGGEAIWSVWGTGVYTSDSSACLAAVHAGVITLARGGRVAVEMRDGRESYAASTRNGVTTRAYGRWNASFVVIDGDAAGAPPFGTATGDVTVNGKGWQSGTVNWGSNVDVSKGTLTVSSALGAVLVSPEAGVQGRFKLNKRSEGSGRRKRTVAELELTGGDFAKECAASASSSARARAAASKKVVRSLWGSGRGRFRTRGRHSAAVVRGTVWRTDDRCDGTLTFVKQGVVMVTAAKGRKTVRVTAGKSYLARR